MSIGDVVGCAVRYGIWIAPKDARDRGLWRAALPGCFDQAIRRGKMRLLLDCRDDRVIASQADRTLQIWEEAGAWLMFRARKVPGDILDLFRQGRVSGVSGRFISTRVLQSRGPGRPAHIWRVVDEGDISILSLEYCPHDPGAWVVIDDGRPLPKVSDTERELVAEFQRKLQR